jgi:hypothetical protein
MNQVNKMHGEEFIRRHGNEKAALTKFLSSKGVSVDELCAEMGSPIFEAFITELVKMGKILDDTVAAAKARDQIAAIHQGLDAKIQKDAVYSVLLMAGINPFEDNCYAKPLGEYVMSRYDDKIHECDRLFGASL